MAEEDFPALPGQPTLQPGTDADPVVAALEPVGDDQSSMNNDNGKHGEVSALASVAQRGEGERLLAALSVRVVMAALSDDADLLPNRLLDEPSTTAQLSGLKGTMLGTQGLAEAADGEVAVNPSPSWVREGAGRQSAANRYQLLQNAVEEEEMKQGGEYAAHSEGDQGSEMEFLLQNQTGPQSQRGSKRKQTSPGEGSAVQSGSQAMDGTHKLRPLEQRLEQPQKSRKVHAQQTQDKEQHLQTQMQAPVGGAAIPESVLERESTVGVPMETTPPPESPGEQAEYAAGKEIQSTEAMPVEVSQPDAAGVEQGVSEGVLADEPVSSGTPMHFSQTPHTMPETSKDGVHGSAGAP
uniref:Uncharacterized protein n=1 Tax=Sphaerodactylus townsendi TaxID=933632 RepID=A0ACB8FEV9_9SAUR